MFPRLDDEGIAPDMTLSETSLSDTEDSVMNIEETFNSKEDEDIAVFIKISKHLPMKSLLFLLQNHARAMLIPESELRRYLGACSNRKPTLPPPQKVKKLRFADVRGGVRAQVYALPPRDHADAINLWWTDQEMQQIRMSAIRIVHYFRNHKPEFAESITVLAESDSPDADDILVDHHMKKLTEDDFARGLETHVVFLLHTLREDGVKTILAEQEACRQECCGYETTCERLRERYSAITLPSRVLAGKMAECDQVIALKASLSKWKPCSN